MRRKKRPSCIACRRAPPVALLDGEIVGQGFDDLQLRTDDHRVHLLRTDGAGFREVTSSIDWPTYNGDTRGNRYTPMTQIDKSQRQSAGRGLDVHARGRSAAGHTCGRRRRHVHRRTERVLCRRCRQRPGNLALQAPQDRRAVDRRTRQPRRRGRRRQGLHGDRQRPHHRDQSHDRGVGLGYRARRLAQELLGLVRASASRQPDHLRRGRRRTWRERVRRRARSGHGQRGLALLHGPEAGRAGIRVVAGEGHRARRRADLVHRQLRSGSRPRLLADRQSKQGIQRRSPQGRQSVFGFHSRPRSEDWPPEVVLPVHAARSVGLGCDRDVGPH